MDLLPVQEEFLRLVQRIRLLVEEAAEVLEEWAQTRTLSLRIAADMPTQEMVDLRVRHSTVLMAVEVEEEHHHRAQDLRAPEVTEEVRDLVAMTIKTDTMAW